MKIYVFVNATDYGAQQMPTAEIHSIHALPRTAREHTEHVVRIVLISQKIVSHNVKWMWNHAWNNAEEMQSVNQHAREITELEKKIAEMHLTSVTSIATKIQQMCAIQTVKKSNKNVFLIAIQNLTHAMHNNNKEN